MRTYSHLSKERRVPSEYEITTSGLLYYPSRGFEVNVPLSNWYREWQVGAKLAAADWDAFVDPRETTYARYVQRAQERENYVDGVLRALDAARADARLSGDYLALLDRMFAPLRYPLHGLQMVAAYVGQMAPSGRVAVAALFQCADEARRIERIAYRMVQIAQTHAGFGAASRATWECDAAWQPMRELVERLLVAWDWTEALFVLSTIAKPALDAVTMRGLASVGRERGGDVSLEALFASFAEDAAWHLEWSRAALRRAVVTVPHARTVLEAWREFWWPFAQRAAVAYGDALGAPSCTKDATDAAEAAFEELVAT
jgi:hypothetical protein